MAAACEITDTEIIFGDESTLEEQTIDVPIYTHTCSNCGTQEKNHKIPKQVGYMCITCDSNDIEEIYNGPHNEFTGSVCLQALFLSKRMRCKNRDCLTKYVVRYTPKGFKMNGEVCKYNSIKIEFPNALDSQGRQLGSCTNENCKFSHEDIKGLYMLAILPDVCEFGNIDAARDPVQNKQSCYKPLAYKDGCDNDECPREHEIVKLLDNIKKPREAIAFQKFLEKGNRIMLKFDEAGNFISDPNIDTARFNKFPKVVIVKTKTDHI